MKKIVIVDDNKMIISVLRFLLTKEGFEVHEAYNGNEGIEKIDTIKPDIVITDVLMPYKSGFEIAFYAKLNYPDLPVIILSNLGKEDQTIIDAFKLGAVDIIAKPFNPVELVLRVKRFIKN
jgi:two-component system, OmpR family, response regulator VicR